MAANLPFCFFVQFLEQLLKFLANFTLLKYVKSQRSYGFLITKKLIFGFQILDLKVHFSGARSKFWGLSGSEDRGGGDNSIQFINIGREGDKSLKERRRKIGGWKGG